MEVSYLIVEENFSNKNDNWITYKLKEDISPVDLFGPLNSYANLISAKTGVELVIRGDNLLIGGENVREAKKILRELEEAISREENFNLEKASYIIDLLETGNSYKEEQLDKEIICFSTRGKPIKPKTKGQKDYVKAIRNKDVVFGIGPAGTGKTYIAIAMAVTAYKKKQVEKIILTRPAVEAGERLGFLPGDLQDKVDPYLRPLYDALYDVLGRDNTAKLREKDIIEVVPLAYMRGRTLDNAFIILDEAQNTTEEQMKMFLTRMGFGSKIVVTGDVTQKDLPKGQKSGLIEAEKILKNVKSIEFCYLSSLDVVRHKVVREIIGAYDAYYKRHKKN